jgi:hypothetical protein
MKCQQYGHIARECGSTQDVCGRCGKDHPTQTCTAKTDMFYCAVCKVKGHIAADRDCPTLQQQIQRRAQRDPTRGYRFYVTDNPETWVRRSDKMVENINQNWRLEVQKGYDQNWKTVQRGKGKGRLAGGQPGNGSGASSQQPLRGRTPARQSAPTAPRQGTLNTYISRSQSRARPSQPSQPRSRGEWGNSSMPPWNRQAHPESSQ